MGTHIRVVKAWGWEGGEAGEEGRARRGSMEEKREHM